MLSKIYFPRLILPLSSVLSALVDSAFSLGPDVRDDGNLPGLAGMGNRVLAGLAADPGVPGARPGTGGSLVDGDAIRDVVHVIPVVLNLGLFISPVAWSTIQSELE